MQQRMVVRRSLVGRVAVRGVSAAALGVAALVVLAGPAGAHVEPSPIAVQAGTSSTITFGVEHGCGDSPLTELEIQVPDGVTDVAIAPAPSGWTGTVADGVVTFVGGPQPAHEGIEFAIQATFPDTPDTTVGFPTVETCQEGSVSWIEPVVEGQAEPELPMPTVTLTAGPPTEAQLTPAEEEGESHEDGDSHDSGEESATTTSAEEGDDSSNTALVIGVVVVALVVAVGGAVLGLRLVRRREG